MLTSFQVGDCHEVVHYREADLWAFSGQMVSSRGEVTRIHYPSYPNPNPNPLNGIELPPSEFHKSLRWWNVLRRLSFVVWTIAPMSLISVIRPVTLIGTCLPIQPLYSHHCHFPHHRRHLPALEIWLYLSKRICHYFPAFTSDPAAATMLMTKVNWLPSMN